MKSLKTLWYSLTAAGALMSLQALAQTNAYDDAYHYTKQTWLTNNLNGGFGFTPWVLTQSGPNSHGYFTTRNATPLPVIASPTNFASTGSAPGNDGAAHVWGMFANGGSAPNFNSAVAYRGFSNSLDTTVVFKLQWENLGAGNTVNNLGGFTLRNGNAGNTTADFQTGLRFAFYYVGGGSNSFSYLDGSGSQQYIGIPFASNPLACEFTLLPGDKYRFVVKSLTTGAILAIIDNQPLAGSGTIDSVALFANQTTGNQNFNRMQIVSASLTPPTVLNAQPLNGSVYVDPTTTNISFEVDSIASTIASNSVTLSLNGVTQTNLLFNTLGATNQLFVTNNAPLLGNVLYNASIVATDLNGNRATNNFTFNTFLQTDNFIEAEDYNFGGGQFLTNAFPNPFGAYSGLEGVNGVDYLDTTPTNLNAYRGSDLTQILAGNDPVDHAGYQAGSYSDYYVGYNEIGDWLDYTRILPATNYTVYARMAGFGTSPIMELERLSPAAVTGSSQPNVALGRFVSPGTGGTANYVFVPLTDFFGNTVQVNFPGLNTFRATSVGGNRSYNLNYFILVPNTNTATLRPYVSVASPAANATGVLLDSAISITLANRQTSVSTGNVQVLLNNSNITQGTSIVFNDAGDRISYTPLAFLTPNTTYTLSVIFSDTSSVTLTNTWQFTTINATVTTIPAVDAKPIGSGGTNGFALSIYKVEDAAATTSTLANAEQELAGARINPNTSSVYPNLALGPNNDGLFLETNAINYDIQGIPTGTPQFPYKSAFPYVAPSGVNNNIALQSLMYVQLNAGFYHFVIRSDDGFKLTAGATTTDTNLVLGFFDGGRGNGAPSDVYFQVLTNGLYPMRLLYFQAGSGGNVEFYSVLNNGTTSVLINDQTNVNSIKVFASLAAVATPVTILNPVHSGTTTTFSFVTQSGHTHYVEYKLSLADAQWTPLQTITGDGSTTNVTDTTATDGTRFYHVRTQ